MPEGAFIGHAWIDGPGAFDPSEHTVTEVKLYADDHPGEAQALLDAEEQGKDRSTLVAYLEALLDRV